MNLLNDPFLAEVLRIYKDGLGDNIVLVPTEHGISPLLSPHHHPDKSRELIRIAGNVLRRVGVPE